jgi:hypothetical protein
VLTSCSYGYGSGAATANGAGSFTVPAGIDLRRGDYAYLYVYDADGNYQYSYQRSVPAIVAVRSAYYGVRGYWGQPNRYLTVVIKDLTGTVKSTNQNVWASSNDGAFSTFAQALPSDRVEVGDGVITETLAYVPDLTARLDDATGGVTGGGAADGPVLGQLSDFRPATHTYQTYCEQATAFMSMYGLAMSGSQIGGQDTANVYNTTSDGHYAYYSAQAFGVNAELGGAGVFDIWGYAETPSTVVTITVLRGGAVVETGTTVVFPTAYYYRYPVTPLPLQAGDVVSVTTSDGDLGLITLPNLTVNANAATNQLHGTSAPNQPVAAELRRASGPGSYYVHSRVVTANGAGSYAASFNNTYWGLDCSPTQVGGTCTYKAVTYYTAAGHSARRNDPVPVSAAADAFEGDDSFAQASAYTGLQSHSFHSTTDTDWIALTVAPDDVGRQLRLRTLNHGFGLDTWLGLYQSDGSTLLASAYGYANAAAPSAVIWWRPTAPGVYYLHVTPYNSSDGAFCGARYDLEIAPFENIYLPLVRRN